MPLIGGGPCFALCSRQRLSSTNQSRKSVFFNFLIKSKDSLSLSCFFFMSILSLFTRPKCQSNPLTASLLLSSSPYKTPFMYPKLDTVISLLFKTDQTPYKASRLVFNLSNSSAQPAAGFCRCLSSFLISPIIQAPPAGSADVLVSNLCESEP